MAKQEAGWSNALSIFWLKKQGYLSKDHSYMSGSITWSYLGEKRASIGFAISKNDYGTDYESAYIQLRYTHTSNWTDEKSDMDFRVQLATTPCKYGGKRYWFVCPLYKGGQYCGRRVGVLYAIGKWYGCRYCGEIAYASQNRGGKYRGSSITIPDIEKLEKEIKRYYYRGRPTRKHTRLIGMNDKLKYSFALMAARLDKGFARKLGI